MTKLDLEEVRVRIRLIEIERKNYVNTSFDNRPYLELSKRLWKLQAEEKRIQKLLEMKN